MIERLIKGLLSAGPRTVAVPSIQAWCEIHDATQGAGFERAVLAGFHADRLGYAFASGYIEAVRALGRSTGNEIVSLAVSEQGPPTPSSIRTTLRDGVVDGTKSFATLGGCADAFLVACTRGERDDGRADIAVVRIARGAPGLTVGQGPSTDFTPEVTHARLTMDGVRVEDADVLAGDGYSGYLKPFRTIEDLHVHGSTLGLLLRWARIAGWDGADRIVGQILALAALSQADPSDPGTHLGLGAVLASSRPLLAEMDQAGIPAGADALLWERDRPLLKVAGAARAARLDKAGRALTG